MVKASCSEYCQRLVQPATHVKSGSFHVGIEVRWGTKSCAWSKLAAAHFDYSACAFALAWSRQGRSMRHHVKSSQASVLDVQPLCADR